MTELRVGARVHGTDGELGRVDALVVDPTARAITHLVVGQEMLARRILVPIDQIGGATPDRVDVGLDRDTFEAGELFDEPNYNEPGADFQPLGMGYEPGAYFLEPFASPLDGWALAEHEHIPKGEITLRRGDEVLTGDGHSVGVVDELLVDPTDGGVTHVVVRQGHLLHHDEDVVVPLGGARFEEGRVVLGVDAAAVDALEHVPVKRHGHVRGASVDPGA
jgi:sporulation protein YlmC with PRC-barrel domain